MFSPRASAMGHHLGNVHTSTHWTEHCNELIRRVCDLYPANFAPVCQLPQSPGAPIDRFGRASCGAAWSSWGSSAATSTPIRQAGGGRGPPMGDRSWYPLYEAMAELDVPGHDPRERHVQRPLPHHRLALPGRRHHGVHAAHDVRRAAATSRVCA